MSGSSRFGRRFAENVGAEVGSAHFAEAFFIKPPSEGAVESLPLTESFAEVADGGSCAAGVVGLLVHGQGREIAAKGVHAETLPFGNSYVNTLWSFTHRSLRIKQ